MTVPRVLLFITAYNGHTIVPRALRSAMQLDTSGAEVDVLLLDDCSPDMEFSEKVASLCAEVGAQYYRSPINLGIPRNCNLGLLAALEGGYTHALMCNSDVVFPRNLVSALLAAASNDDVGSVTAWSNNVSIYSLPNADPDALLSEQDVVDEVSEALAIEFGSDVLDIPSGIGFAMLMPTPVIREVGLQDPVFGRGYCEELDWCLRAKAAGFRSVLAPGVFMYHSGRGSNIDAGVLSAEQTTVPANEAIIDLRYPDFRTDVAAFFDNGDLPRVRRRGELAVIRNAVLRDGYDLQVGWLPIAPVAENRVHALISPEGSRAVISLRYRGFRYDVRIVEAPLRDQLHALLGADPRRVEVSDGGRAAISLVEGLGVTVASTPGYPTRI